MYRKTILEICIVIFRCGRKKVHFATRYRENSMRTALKCDGTIPHRENARVSEIVPPLSSILFASLFFSRFGRRIADKLDATRAHVNDVSENRKSNLFSFFIHRTLIRDEYEHAGLVCNKNKVV